MQLDDEDIKSYQKRRLYEFEKPKHEAVSGSTIFIAVLAAIITAWFLRDAYETWKAQQALKLMTQQLSALAAQSDNRLRNIQIQNELASAKALELSRQKAEETQKVKAAAIQRDLYEREQKAAELKKLADKENAWENYYKPTSGCESDNPNRETIKCGNDYLKARKEFEAEWLKVPAVR